MSMSPFSPTEFAGLECLSTGALILDAAGAVVYVNPAAETLLGVSGVLMVGADAATTFERSPELLAAIDTARSQLEAWRGASGVVRSREEVIRLAIEEALLASHRHVFGVLLWFVILPGPSGAILYRLAAYLAGRWKPLLGFGEFAQRIFYYLDWPAVRLTAASFAVVGDFEDAIYCWRTQARTWLDENRGVVLAAGAGAMGVRLGMPVQEIEGADPRPELGVGEPADGPFLDSAVGLVWRALVVWVFALGVISVARLL